MVVALIEEQEYVIKNFGKPIKKYEFGQIKVTEFNYNGCKLFMADSGVGEISAALSTQMLILQFNVDVILNFGVVGSLSSDLNCGGVVYVGEIVHHDFTTSYKNKDMAGKYLFQMDSFVFEADKNMIEIAQKVIDAARPSLDDVRHAYGLGFFSHDLLGLFLGCDEEHLLARFSNALQRVGGLFYLGGSLIEVDDVDTVALHEDIGRHSRIPFSFEVTEMATCF